MTSICVSVELDAPPARVWDVVEPIEHHVDWMHDAVAIRFDGEQRRELTLQYDLVEAYEVVESLTASFQDAGFTAVTATDDELTFERPGTGSVTATVTPLADAEEGSIVRGTVTR